MDPEANFDASATTNSSEKMGMTKPQFALALLAAAMLSFGCSQPTETQLTSDSELTAVDADYVLTNGKV